MKTRLLLNYLICIAFTTLISGTSLFSQYSGEYFISDTSFFKSFNQAVDSVKSQGVNGMLTFLVMPGEYNERLNIEHVLTTDESRQVTFKSYYGDSSQVVLTDSCHIDSNFVIRLGEGCNYWNFEGITIKSRGDLYGYCVFLDHYPQNIRFSNCHISGIYSSPGSSNGNRILVFSTSAYIDYLTFENNLFEFGSTALYLHGNNNGTGYIEGIDIQNNRFQENGYQGILIHNGVSPVISNNYIQCYDDGIAISVAYITATITNNKIFAEDVGISFNTSGYYNPNAIIANNFIHLGVNGDRGISLGGGNGAIDIFHNTILILDEYFQTYGIYFGGNSINARYRVKNNIIACLNGGSPLYIYSLNEIAELDYNAYYTPGDFFAYVGGKGRLFNLDDYTDSTGFDEHSYMAYPYFVSDSNLHAKTSWFNNRGTPLPEVTEDYDGDLRDPVHPDIGADEYVPEDENLYAGSYTIGTGGYFDNLDQAIDSLKLKGISGNTSLEFLDGTYLIKSKLPTISGAMEGSILTLTSQSSDAERVVLKHHDVSQSSNYILWLDGTDFLTIRDLTFRATDNTSYGVNLWFRGGAEKLEITDNVFKSTNNSNNTGAFTLFYSSENFYRDFAISHNEFDSCAHAIYFQFSKNEWERPAGIIIDSNSFTNVGYSAVLLQRTMSSQVSNNVISAGARGIQFISNANDHKIIGNKIELKYGQGIYVGSTVSTPTQPGLIANNFITVGGVGESYGISLITTDYQNIFHNSINITSTSATSGRAFYSSSCDHLTLYNNIFNNSEGGYSYYSTVTIVDSSDYNDLYTTGSNLANVGGAIYTNLDELRSGVTREYNSVSTDPVFISASDLHLADDTLAYLGYPIPDIVVDIDGENRDLLTPSIGADEYSPFINNPPYVDMPISDQIFMVNTGTHEIALLDTVFKDDDSGDQLEFNVVSDNPSILAALSNTTIQIQGATDYTGQATIVASATDLYSAFASDTFIVTIIDEGNTPPVAVNDTVVTYTTVMVKPLENDYDVDGDEISLTWVGPPQQGTVHVLGDTAFNYNPAGHQLPHDTVKYAITDGNGGYDTAMVFITISLLQNRFTITNIDLDSISHGSVAWGDYDADGDLDLLMTGWLGTYQNHTSKLYKNIDGNLIDSEVQIQAVSAGSDKSCAWTDFNNDGQLDFIITGTKDGETVQYYSMIYVQDDGAFSPVDFGIQNVTSSSVDWADFDNDGDYDLLINGKGSDNFAGVYINDYSNSESFLYNSFELEGLWNSVALWGDFDGDDDFDILSSGWEGSYSQYRNDSMVFNTLTSVLNTVDGHTADIGDYDMDGDMDIVMLATNADTAYSCVYRCEEHESEDIWSYSLLAYIQDIESGTSIWGDYDNDGDLDLFISGTKTGLETHSVLYENPEGFAFSPIETGIPDLGRSAAAWGDYDNDNDLDLIVTGFGDEGPVSIVVRNESSNKNTKPLAPTGLLEDIYKDKINLYWNESSDNETAQAGLTYNIRMGTTPGACDIISPLSLSNGYRQVPRTGNAGQGNRYMLYGLNPGTTYYWSVQTIDNNFAGSEFAAEKSFTTLSTGINDKNSPEYLSIYPNPTDGKVQVKVNTEFTSDLYIEVINETGQIVQIYDMKGVASPESLIELTIDNPGIYYIKLRTDKGISISKVVRY